MGIIRKTLSITYTGGLIGFRSKSEKVQRAIRQSEKNTRQTAAESRRQNVLIEKQNGLIQEQTDAIIRQQQALIDQQAEAMRRQEEQLRTLRSVSAAPMPEPAEDSELVRVREAALGAFKAHEHAQLRKSSQ